MEAISNRRLYTNASEATEAISNRRLYTNASEATEAISKGLKRLLNTILTNKLVSRILFLLEQRS